MTGGFRRGWSSLTRRTHRRHRARTGGACVAVLLALCAVGATQAQPSQAQPTRAPPPQAQFPQAELLQEGESIELDLPGRAVVREGGQRLPCEPIPDFLLEMVQAGGLLAQLKKSLQAKKVSP